MKTTEERVSEYGQEMEETISKCGEEAYDKTGRAVSDIYDKTSKAVNSTYEQAIRYSRENPGKTTLIALGVGFGLGVMMSGGSRHRGGRYAQPMVNALSDIAAEFFR
jgi:ElaB protein